jgi:hypothetical protein
LKDNQGQAGRFLFLLEGYTTPTSGSIIGETLKLQLASLPEQSNAFQPSFDNVTLNATSMAVPEPATGALLVSGLLTLCWLIRRKRISQQTQAERQQSLRSRSMKIPVRLALIVLVVVTLGISLS